MKCAYLIFRKIIQFVDTRFQILSLKSTHIDFGWGSDPDHAGGVYSAPPDPWLDLRGPSSKGRKEKGRGLREKGEGKK